MVKLQRAHGECLGTRSRRRTRQAAISFVQAQIACDPEISEWGNPHTNRMYHILNKQVYGDKPGELKHLSTQRKRKKNRFPKQRRAKGKEPKPETLSLGLRMAHNAVYLNRRVLESSTTEGNSPVGKKRKLQEPIQSTTRHVKPCGKQGGPPPKAKYYLMTDSEAVP